MQVTCRTKIKSKLVYLTMFARVFAMAFKLHKNLRAATAESEKAVLQNAVAATDQQIDALLYELYGLTPEEIQLVEGGQ